METKEILREIERSETTAIYGAHVVAFGVYTALRALYGVSVRCFLVTKAEGSPETVDGVPVLPLREAGLDPARTLVLIATTELFHEEIQRELRALGFERSIPIGTHEEHLFLSAYFESVGRFSRKAERALLRRASSVGPTPDSVGVYAVRSQGDKPLRSEARFSHPVVPILAGAALSDGPPADPVNAEAGGRTRLAARSDDTGENISRKNRRYCELTATYWVWKNATQDVKGIFHYRRHLILRTGEIDALLAKEIDAALPLPYLCRKDAKAQFGRFVPEEAWRLLEEAAHDVHSRQCAEISRILRGPLLYPYNMLCARAEVFDAYCEWLFPVLFRMEELGRGLPVVEETRALAYAGEALTSVYFLLHESALRVSHAEKRILV
ncbi:MAG: DUF4422 domain-containing protein [Clostridiales Family XIII bacterium]|nr:DUF4422 domain-containing protein [Clostridiales Family XIII bacterium]